MINEDAMPLSFVTCKSLSFVDDSGAAVDDVGDEIDVGIMDKSHEQ